MALTTSIDNSLFPWSLEVGGDVHIREVDSDLGQDLTVHPGAGGVKGQTIKAGGVEGQMSSVLASNMNDYITVVQFAE